MNWHSILISKGSKLSLKKNQLFIQQESQEFTVPLEDIAVIVVESKEVSITIPLLSALALNGVTLLSCDDHFLPCGQWLPFCQYYRQLKVLKLQIGLSLPQKKRLCQVILQRKIANQAFVLGECGFLREADHLQVLAHKVRSGDSTHVEGHAAGTYFRTLLGKRFTRSQESFANACLNYVYSILRSAIARTLVLYGWHPSLGLFHRNELNAFNLADDFLEPFRPLGDLLALSVVNANLLDDELTPKIKQMLIRILHQEILIGEEVFSVLSAIDKCVGSFQDAVATQNPSSLVLPSMTSLREYCYE